LRSSFLLSPATPSLSPEPAFCMMPTGGTRAVEGVDVRDLACDRCSRRSLIVLRIRLFPQRLPTTVGYGLSTHARQRGTRRRLRTRNDFIFAFRRATTRNRRGRVHPVRRRRLVSFARAILKNAPILILRRAHSSLDAIAEEIVFAASAALRAGRTHRHRPGCRRYAMRTGILSTLRCEDWPMPCTRTADENEPALQGAFARRRATSANPRLTRDSTSDSGPREKGLSPPCPSRHEILSRWHRVVA